MKQAIAGYEHISGHKPLYNLNWKSGLNRLIRIAWFLGRQVAYSYQLTRQRRQLAQLSDDQLRDIGISRSDAQREARRPFWDEPKQA
ncbi:MAG: DUF1127 domain-containing protein [Sedimenticola sp.]